MKKAGYIFIIGVLALYLAVITVAILTEYDSLIDLMVRLLALTGYYALSIATIMTPFLVDIRKVLGWPFIRVHHIFAVFGIAAIISHPIFNAIQRESLSVFIPNLSSWTAFWLLAGRPALYVIILAAIAALARRLLGRSWRAFHATMYIALFFGIVHANLIGTDFSNPFIAVVFNGLFMAAVLAFGLKRYQEFRMRKKLEERRARSRSG